MPVRLKGFRTRIDLVQHNPVGLVMRYDYLEFQRTLVTISFGVPFGSHRQHRVELRIALRLRREGHTQSRLRKSEQDDKWSFCLTAGTIIPRIRRDIEQTSTLESLTGLPCEG